MPIIILVDDGDEDHYLFHRAVNDISNQCIINYANCGNELFDLLYKVTPEFIFLDISPPAEEGLTCLKKLRAQTEYDSIPILMYSSSLKYMEECYSNKANFYIKKSTSYPIILTALKKVLLLKSPGSHPPIEQFVIE